MPERMRKFSVLSIFSMLKDNEYNSQFTLLSMTICTTQRRRGRIWFSFVDVIGVRNFIECSCMCECHHV
jgi:hypothetical protein